MRSKNLRIELPYIVSYATILPCFVPYFEEVQRDLTSMCKKAIVFWIYFLLTCEYHDPSTPLCCFAFDAWNALLAGSCLRCRQAWLESD